MPRSGWRGAPSRRGAAAYGVAYLLSGRQFSLQKCDFVFCGKGEKSPVASKYCGKPLRGCVGSRSAAGAAAPRLVGARIQCILKNADFPTWCTIHVRGRDDRGLTGACRSNYRERHYAATR